MKRELSIAAGILAAVGLAVNAGFDLDNGPDMTTTGLWIAVLVVGTSYLQLERQEKSHPRGPQEPARPKGVRSVEYEYILGLRALDTLTSAMKRDGVSVPESFNLVSFKSPRLVDMERYRESGVISSYVIIKSERRDQIVDEGMGEDAAHPGP